MQKFTANTLMLLTDGPSARKNKNAAEKKTLENDFANLSTVTNGRVLQLGCDRMRRRFGSVHLRKYRRRRLRWKLERVEGQSLKFTSLNRET